MMKTRTARLSVAAVVAAFAQFLLLSTFSSCTSKKTFPPGLPNILVIMTDDQRYDTLNEQFMPNTMALIADKGVTFRRAYVPTAMCGPSRASFLTGKYARNNGVRVNIDKLSQPTFVDRLKQSGYFTGLIGKYLNSWSGKPRPEFNYWLSWGKGYVDPEMNVSGEVKSVPGYLEQILRENALGFLDRVPTDEPFFLLYAPHAPHKPATPAPGDESLYSDLSRWRPPSFNGAQMTGKPAWLQQKRPLPPEQVAIEVDEMRLNQLRALKQVDISVRDILGKLRDQGKLDNTLIVFFSDNGYFWGEHRLITKNRVYEEASRIPLLIRYPALVDAARTEDRLVAVIDLAPTIYELVGIPIPEDVDGTSLLPLLKGTDQWRDALLLEGWPRRYYDDEDEDIKEKRKLGREQRRAHYQAIRTAQYVYSETDLDTAELYDTLADPYQLTNLVNDPRHLEVAALLKERLYSAKF